MSNENGLVGTIWHDQLFGFYFIITNQEPDDHFGNVCYSVLYSDGDSGLRLHDELIEQHKMVRLT